MARIIITLLFFVTLGITSFFIVASEGNLEKDQHFSTTQFNSKIKEFERSDTLSVMTFNIGYLSGMTNNLGVDRAEDLYRQNLSVVLETFEHIRPDMVGLQEIDFGSNRSFMYNQLDSLALPLDYPYAYRSVNWDKKFVPFPYWPLGHQFGKMLSGQAVLSMFPVLNEQTVTLIKPMNTSFLYNAFYIDRLVQVCDLVLAPGDTIRMMNLHLEAFDKETRLAQAETVKQIFESYSDQLPVLLIGDFNSPPAYLEPDDAMNVIMSAKHIRSAVDSVTYQNSPMSFNTFTSRQPYQMIDYILYNENFITRVEQSVISRTGEVSDHLPVLMKFVLRGENDEN
ncbi:MAG: endonuclease/exonuclease/phosphatase family protein [Marinoscillum sp.]|uniref:endonuclease/exonuclease/phosphatase family protein n=1 Tax=Marinoscillum sp. TaxID=2024838 RepID=UPI0033015158